MALHEGIPSERFRPILRKDLDSLPQIQHLNPEERLEMRVVSAVLPFRTNAYVVDHLIDWDNIPFDPMYQLTFPQRGMLDPNDFGVMADLVENDAPAQILEAAA